MENDTVGNVLMTPNVCTGTYATNLKSIFCHGIGCEITDMAVMEELINIH